MKVTEIKKAGTILLACIFAMVVIQLAAPIILGILVQGAALTVPLGVYHFFIKGKWRLHFVQDKRDSSNPAGENSMAEKFMAEPESGEEKTADSRWNHLNQYRNQTSEKVETEPGDSQTEDANRTFVWYEEQGRDKILGIVRKLSARNIYECWVKKDGICNIRTGKGYRRTGTLPGFDSVLPEILIDLLTMDGITAEIHGKYLYLIWKDFRRADT